jgi:hypothetical protein
MSSTNRNAKSGSIQDTAAERWSRLYVDVRASYGRAAIQAAFMIFNPRAPAKKCSCTGIGSTDARRTRFGDDTNQ